MLNNKNFINLDLDKSFDDYIKPVVQINTSFYRIFDNNCDNDRVIINGKIEKLFNQPKNLNNLLNIDISCGNIVNIPMLNDIYIEYLSTKQIINIKDLNILNQVFRLDSDNVKFLSIKYDKNIIFQDIIIHTSKNIIIIQLYKFKIPVEDITHGAVIIFQNNNYENNLNNTIYYTKENNQLLIDNITNIEEIDNNYHSVASIAPLIYHNSFSSLN